MKGLTKWIECLSLDAVIVAVLWGMAMGMRDLAELVVLALATWLTYVADRLRDVAPSRGALMTDRHVYYRDHYKGFVVSWICGFVGVIVLALLALPLWKIGWGLVLVGLILFYLWALRQIERPGSRLLFKRTAVPLIFAAGVCWMAEGWRSHAGIYLTILLFAGALVNVLLISYWENRYKNPPKWLPHMLGAGIVGMFCLSQFGLLYFTASGIGGLVTVFSYFIILLLVQAEKASNVRAWTDLALAAGAVFILVIEILS
ncbi:MAG: hypothetical protein AB3N63_18065 [Puniceicoccaceae bacterium]